MVAGIIRAAILGVLAVPLVGFAAGMAARNVEWVDADPELRAAAVEAAGFAWISCRPRAYEGARRGSPT